MNFMAIEGCLPQRAMGRGAILSGYVFDGSGLRFGARRPWESKLVSSSCGCGVSRMRISQVHCVLEVIRPGGFANDTLVIDHRGNKSRHHIRSIGTACTKWLA
jgi:hypothetical protein